MTRLPPEFLFKMQSLLGDEFGDFLRSYQKSPRVGLRINSLKIAEKEFLQLAPYPLKPVRWVDGGFLAPPDSRPGKHPYHAAGLYYLQDPSAMAVGVLLNPKPGERILDIAAAPGGKSTHIVSLMSNKGVFVANDAYSGRASTLAGNLDRWGATNAIVTNESPTRLFLNFGSYFDKVLVDAPCSGEGMFRKEPKMRKEWGQKLVLSYANRQESLLHQASMLVRSGGNLVYATCTFSPEENEGTIARFLKNHPDFRLVDVPFFDGFACGNPEWVDSAIRNSSLSKCVRLYPHRIEGEGHFIAVMQKKHTTDNEEIKPRWGSRSPGLPRGAQVLFNQFTHKVFREDIFAGVKERLGVIGNFVYLLPQQMPEIGNLRVLRWGWWLGTLKRNRFEPSYAFAMGVQPRVVKQPLLLRVDDPKVMVFLRGGMFPSNGDNGWVLITVDGFPLGWGKRVNQMIKSHSPKWFRWI